MNGSELISWLKRGKNRMKVFASVSKHTTPSEIVGKISKRSGRKAMTDYVIVSRALDELEKKKLVRLMVKEKTRVGRTYELTSRGKLVKKELGLISH